MSDKEKSVFDQYAPAKTRKLEVIDGGKPKTGKEPYKAYDRDKPNNRTVRLRIEYGDPDRTVSSMSKSYLVEALYTSKRYLSLIFTNAEFELQGENLDRLVELLDDDQIKALYGFSAQQHEKPEEGEPVITQVRRAVLREAVVMGGEEEDSSIDTPMK